MTEFVEALVASDPHKTVRSDVFGPFIGSWSLTVTWFDECGREIRRSDGEWHFARVLEGRGIQDVWIVPSRSCRDATNAYEYGTSLRFAEEDGTWRSTWIGPQQGVVRTFIARPVDDGVSLETLPGPDPAMRWQFYNISADRFEWRNVLVGAPDRVTQHFLAVRR